MSLFGLGEMRSYLQWQHYVQLSQHMRALHLCDQRNALQLSFVMYCLLMEWSQDLITLCYQFAIKHGTCKPSPLYCTDVIYALSSHLKFQ
jgi:hypothetical protein